LRFSHTDWPSTGDFIVDVIQPGDIWCFSSKIMQKEERSIHILPDKKWEHNSPKVDAEQAYCSYPFFQMYQCIGYVWQQKKGNI
jgi:hypothetical protein